MVTLDCRVAEVDMGLAGAVEGKGLSMDSGDCDSAK